MEFKDFFSTLKNRISDGYDVPQFFRDLFAMITDVPESEWGTPQDPATKKTKDDTLRSYAKRSIPKKFAQQIVYRLSPNNYIDSVNSRPAETLRLLADDFSPFDSEVTAKNVAEKSARWFIEIIQKAAGLAPKGELEQQKQQQLALELKSKYGLYLLGEVGHCCPFPGCGRTLTKMGGGKTVDVYEISLVDKTKSQDMEKSISMLLALFDRYKDIEEFKSKVAEHKHRLEAFREARKYQFVSNLVGGVKKYEENLAKIRDLELQLVTLTEEAEKGHTEEEIEKNKQKANLITQRYNIEAAIQAKERKLRLIDMSLEYGLYPTEADMSALQEYFPSVNLRKLYEVEKYHQKLAKILDEQFASERAAIQAETEVLQTQLQTTREQISQLGFVGNISKEFLDRHSELKGEIEALRSQNQAFLTQKELQDAKAKAEEALRHSIEDILSEIEDTLNTKMKEFNDTLFRTHRKPPHIRFIKHDSYRFETPDDTGTGSNYKGMIVYDLAVLFTTALPAIAHDSLIFKNLEKDVEDGIMRIYTSTSKQIFIAYDKQGDYRPETQTILEENCVLRLSNNNCELYGRSWNKEEQE